MKSVPLENIETPCPYFETKRCTSESFLGPGVTHEELDDLLDRGYRHFGYYFFRPVCDSCRRCIPIRVPIKRYRSGKSARRLINRNSRFALAVTKPMATMETFGLYRHHQKRFSMKGAENFDQYVNSFFFPTIGNRQLSVFEGNKLIAVLHFDLTPKSLSTVYCYYDDSYTRESLGSFSIYRALEIAIEARVQFLHLGYIVPGNRHMSYKTRYRPTQILTPDGWIDFMDRNGTMLCQAELDARLQKATCSYRV